MQDDNISDNTRKTLKENNIPAEEMTSSELRELDSEINE